MTNPKLKKAELRDYVKGINTERTGETLTNKELELLIEDVLLGVEQALLDGYDVPLGNIGTFKQKVRNARKGRNPKTGEPIEIAEAKALGFTPSKNFKAELNA